MTRRDLAGRIRRLEVMETSNRPREPLVFLVGNPARNGEAGARTVIDWFRDSGNLRWARERMTSNVDDPGRRCPADGYLTDVLADVHQQCPWREKQGTCRICQGTPIAVPGCTTTEDPGKTQ